MAYFQTKNPDSGKFWRLLKWKMLVYYMAVWSILRLFGTFCGHSVYFIIIWYILVCCTKKNLATLGPSCTVSTEKLFAEDFFSSGDPIQRTQDAAFSVAGLFVKSNKG
jgi:hypothetical protein